MGRAACGRWVMLSIGRMTCHALEANLGKFEVLCNSPKRAGILWRKLIAESNKFSILLMQAWRCDRQRSKKYIIARILLAAEQL